MLGWLLKAKEDSNQVISDQQNAVQEFLPLEVLLDGKVLVCNGMGTRKRLGIQVYDMALYLPQKTRDAKIAIEMPGVKQIRLVALRDISGDTLASAFLTGIKKNTLPEHHKDYLSQLGQILKVFKTQKKVSAGQSFHIDLIPEQGAFFRINEELKGQSIYIPGFNEAILNIWLGEVPADESLKAALLTG